MEPADRLGIRHLIEIAWDLSNYSSDRAVMDKLLDHYLLVRLLTTNYAHVAVADDKIVGILLGRNEKMPLPDVEMYAQIKRLNEKKLSTSIGSPTYLSHESTIDKVDKSMMAPHKGEFDSELILFITDSEIRGQGVGRKLLSDFTESIKDSGCSNMFLFTDSFCNVQFYRDAGYVERETTSTRLKGMGKKSSFYMFSKDI